MHKTEKHTAKMPIKEDSLYFPFSTEQPPLLNIWLFQAVLCSHVYSISGKFGWFL